MKINLRPLHTEGQGLPSAGKEYSKLGIGISVGIGLKIGIDQVWRLQFELSFTQTFTDYLDDVSGIYYDHNLIKEVYGSMAVYFTSPATGKKPYWTTPTGAIRGNLNYKDAYLFLNISFVRNMTFKGPNKVKWRYKRNTCF